MTHPADFGLSSPLGIFTVDSAGKAEVTFTPVKDYKKEGSEILEVLLVGATIGGEHWKGKNVTALIKDTSLPTPTSTPTATPTPIPSYELTASATEIDEGDPLTITLKTKNVPPNAKVGYAMTHPVDFGKQVLLDFLSWNKMELQN